MPPMMCGRRWMCFRPGTVPQLIVVRSRWPLVLLTRGLHLSKGQLVDVEGRLQTRQWDDDAGKSGSNTEIVVALP